MGMPSRERIFSAERCREALTYGIHRQVSDQEILEAAKQSGFYDTIQAWDDGLDTMIAANGSSLSGGQRQRLVLTREFLRNGEILLLDEPTSALDAVAAKSVQDTIYQLFQGKTESDRDPRFVHDGTSRPDCGAQRRRCSRLRDL